MPEIRIRFREFDRHVAFAVAPAADGHYFAFYFFSGDFVFELKNLAQHHALFQLDRRAVQAHRMRHRPHRKSLADFGFPANAQRHSQHHPHGAAPLFTPKMKYRHGGLATSFAAAEARSAAVIRFALHAID